jgi:SRSO17 transposase
VNASKERSIGFAERVAAYANLFREEFRRRDRARWAGIYLQGLLQGRGRKTIEALARGIHVPDEMAVQDLAQALQNFVNQSPWDEGRVWRRYRAILAPWMTDPEGVFVIEDITFPKHGRHSVGVQRQFSCALGKKMNCQIAVSVHYVSTRGYCPLALRLYLPKAWLRDTARLDTADVPQRFREYRTKGQIARGLLDEIRVEGWPARCIIGGRSYGSCPDFLAGLGEHRLAYLVEIPEIRDAVDRGCHLLQAKLGLNQFEGRSWRGFHHHACLVMLGYGFLLAQQINAEKLGSAAQFDHPDLISEHN